MNRLFKSSLVIVAGTTGRAALLLALAAFSNAQYAMANLVRNGAFDEPGAVTSPQPPISRPDNRMPSWMMRAEWYVDKSAAPPLKDAQVLRADGGGAGRQLFQYLYLEAGKKYTLSAWVKGKGLTHTSGERGDKRTGILITDWRWTEKRTIDLSDLPDSEWQRVHTTFVAPEPNVVGGVEQPSVVRLYLPEGEEGTLWVTGIQIEEGEEVGDFQFVSTVQRRDAIEKVQKLTGALKAVQLKLEGFEGETRDSFKAEIDRAQLFLAKLQAQLDSHTGSGTKEWTLLEAELEKAEQMAGRYTAPFGWWSNPWENLPVRALPGEIGQIGKNEVEIVRAVNDYGALLLPIANLSDDTIPVEVQVGTEVAPLSTQSTFSGPIKVSTCYWVSNDGYVSTLSPVKKHRRFPYFLQALPSSNTTLLPSNETTQLWFDVNTKGMKPGVYRYPVKLIGINREYTWEGNIVLKVLPVTLPEKVPATVMAYSNMPFYMQPFSPHSGKPILKLTPEERLEIARPWLKAWEEMGFNRLSVTNHFIQYKFDKEGHLAAPVDYAAFDAYHELWKEITDQYWAGWNLGAYHIYKNWRDFAQIHFTDVERNRTKAVLKSFLDHAESVGITRDSMVLCLFDEPHGKRIDITRLGIETLKEISPGWKIMAAVSGTVPSRMDPLLPLLDIFVVRQRMGEMDMTPETIEYLKKHGKEVWGYACSGSLEYSHPYRYYRLLPWQAWANGLSGYAMYMQIQHREYPVISARSSFFSPLFLGKDGPVYGRGARGFQLGGRDWTIFSVAKEMLERNPNTDTSKLQALLTTSLKQVVEEDENGALADEVRSGILLELARLQEALANP